MTNYAVVDWVSATGSLTVVAALVETYLETVTDSFTIRDISYVKVGNETFQAVIIHDAS